MARVPGHLHDGVQQVDPLYGFGRLGAPVPRRRRLDAASVGVGRPDSVVIAGRSRVELRQGARERLVSASVKLPTYAAYRSGVNPPEASTAGSCRRRR